MFSVLLAAGFLVTVGDGLAAVKMKPRERAASHLKVAQSFYMAGRYGEALSSVESSIREDSSYVPAHQLRGQILVSLDKLEDAVKEFDRALQIDKKYTEARNWKGYVLVQLKRNDEAMAEFKKALEDLTYPTPEMIHLNIGKLHRLMGHNDLAVASLKESVSLNPSFASGYYELGVTYEKMGKDPEALRAYQDALVGMDNSPDLNLRLGLALAKSGNAPKAKEHFEKVIKLAPDGPEAVQARDAMKKLQPTS
jgi:superkiller protein 3